MLEVDGEEYECQTPAEAATDLVNYINNYCQNNNIVNSKGETIYIDVSPTNPLYIICYGLGYLTGILQKMIYHAACAFSFSSSTEKQLLRLGQVAGISRRPASYSTMNVLVYASPTGNVEVPTDASITVPANGSTVVFTNVSDKSLAIEAGGTGLVVLRADSYGAYSIAEGTASAFDSNIVNLRAIRQYASVPGQGIESIKAYRKRLQTNATQASMVDKCITALNSLSGITLANVIYNPSCNTDLVISGISVPPRDALLVVQGYSKEIADTYFKWMVSETCNPDTPETQVQYYTSGGGQKFPCYFISPTPQDVYIRIYHKDEISDVMKQSVIDEILTLNAELKIGNELNSADVINKVTDNIGLQSVEVTLDTSNYTYRAKPDQIGLLILNQNNIQFVSTSE